MKQAAFVVSIVLLASAALMMLGGAAMSLKGVYMCFKRDKDWDEQLMFSILQIMMGAMVGVCASGCMAFALS